MRAPHLRPIVIAAGGTGGHFYPAAALSDALASRGQRVVLMTDRRTGARSDTASLGAFEQRIILRGAGIAGRGRLRAASALAALALGSVQARRHLSRLNAACVVGFGGYPAVPPVLAAATLGLSCVLHEQNAVLGRANRFLAHVKPPTPSWRNETILALSFENTAQVPPGARCRITGNPVRGDIRAAPYTPPTDTLRILVLGGSLGARVLSDIVPAALAALILPAGQRLHVTQQCRAEDLDRVRAAYAAAGIHATLETFFSDVAALLRDAHLVIARAGASTVAELGVVGRPAILIPLPGAIDNHQLANASQLGAACLREPVTPAALRNAIDTLLQTPRALTDMAATIAAAGRPDAAARLADLVVSLLPAEVPA